MATASRMVIDINPWREQKWVVVLTLEAKSANDQVFIGVGQVCGQISEVSKT